MELRDRERSTVAGSTRRSFTLGVVTSMAPATTVRPRREMAGWRTSSTPSRIEVSVSVKSASTINATVS